MQTYEKYLLIAEALEQEADDMQYCRDINLVFSYKPKEIRAVREAAERFRYKAMMESKPTPGNYAIAE